MNIQVKRGVCNHRVGSKILSRSHFETIWIGTATSKLEHPLAFASSSEEIEIYSISDGQLYKVPISSQSMEIVEPESLEKIEYYKIENIFNDGNVAESEAKYQFYLGAPINSNFPFISFEQEFLQKYIHFEV